jgi:hypothetical protein
MPRRKDPSIPDAVLDQLLAGADPKTVFDPNGLLDDLKKALAERVLNAEMDHHLAAGVHRNDLFVEPREAALVLGDQLRIKAGVAVTRNLRRSGRYR